MPSVFCDCPELVPVYWECLGIGFLWSHSMPEGKVYSKAFSPSGNNWHFAAFSPTSSNLRESSGEAGSKTLAWSLFCCGLYQESWTKIFLREHIIFHWNHRIGLSVKRVKWWDLGILFISNVLVSNFFQYLYELWQSLSFQLHTFVILCHLMIAIYSIENIAVVSHLCGGLPSHHLWFS